MHTTSIPTYTATREMGYGEEQRREEESKGSIEQSFVALSIHFLFSIFHSAE